MWKDILQVIYRLFGIKPRINPSEIDKNRRDVQRYEDITKENFTAIFSRTLSVLAFGDSTMHIVPKDKTETKRIKFLDSVAERFWGDIKENVALGNGCGMIATVPYVINGRMYYGTVTKDRIVIDEVQGDDIVSCTILSDVIETGTDRYERWTGHRVDNGIYVIVQRATKNGEPVALTDVPEWATITPEIHISGVDRLPIGVYKCPTSNRRPNMIYGVPITYGTDATMQKIYECFEQIDKEFKNKSVRIFADETMFGPNDRFSDVYVKVKSFGKVDEKSPFEVFDPAFRETALFANLERLFAQLEREVGTSKGILTEMSVQGGTATEVRRAMLLTFNLCDDIRVSAIKYINGFFYGANMLANYYNLTPPSDYEVDYEWSYSLLEDAESTFRQYMEAHSINALGPAEIRNWLKPEETMEESEAKVLEIEQALKIDVGLPHAMPAGEEATEVAVIEDAIG